MNRKSSPQCVPRKKWSFSHSANKALDREEISLTIGLHSRIEREDDQFVSGGGCDATLLEAKINNIVKSEVARVESLKKEANELFMMAWRSLR